MTTATTPNPNAPTTPPNPNATPTPTAPTAIEAAQQRLAEKRKSLDAAIANRQTAINRLTIEQTKLAEMETAAKNQRDQINRAESSIKDAEKAEAAAELEVKRAMADIPPERVTIDAARLAANDLLAAFDRYREPSAKTTLQQRVDSFWDVLDATRSRLLSTDVDDAARMLVLSIEAVAHSCTRWEEDRSGRHTLDTAQSVVMGLGDCPPDNRHCQKMETALRSFMAGEVPTVKMPNLGLLISDGHEIAFLGKVAGLVRPNGSICLKSLGRLMSATDPQGPAYQWLAWMGCRSVETAWRLRQDAIPSRRALRRDDFAASAVGTHRPHRELGGDHSTWERGPMTEAISSYANRYARTPTAD